MARTMAKVVMFSEEGAEVSIEQVVDANAEIVETKSGIYALEYAKNYVDAKTGHLVYVFNADIPARVEAENLKRLRRSTVLNKLFDFERQSGGGIDWVKVLPYIIILFMIVFHK